MTHGYVEGFLRAADRLVQHVVDTERDQDYLVYPIAFLYRQHVELLLKQLISTGRALLTDKADHPTHHRLHDLWPCAKGLLRKILKGPDPEEFEHIDVFVNEFRAIDHNSTAFRYPHQTNGATSLDGVRHVSLRNLSVAVHAFSEFLQGTQFALEEILDAKCESEAGQR